MSSATDIARILVDALPNMQRYSGKVVVIKYGGHAIEDQEGIANFARDVTLLKQAGLLPVVVHGGGPQVGSMLERLGIKSEFSDGLRITDQSTVDIVEMVLAGSINKSIVSAINQVGGVGIGICGKDGNLVLAEKITRTKRDPGSNIERIIDLGFVGEPAEINTNLLDMLLETDAIPVIAPVAGSRKGQTYNINADTFAGAIAGAIGAERLLLLTDVEGVKDGSGQLLRSLSRRHALEMISQGTASGGMIPKLETALLALKTGVSGVVILSGKVPHACLIELMTEVGAGTLIVEDEEATSS